MRCFLKAADAVLAWTPFFRLKVTGQFELGSLVPRFVVQSIFIESHRRHQVTYSRLAVACADCSAVQFRRLHISAAELSGCDDAPRDSVLMHLSTLC